MWTHVRKFTLIHAQAGLECGSRVQIAAITLSPATHPRPSRGERETIVYEMIMAGVVRGREAACNSRSSLRLARWQLQNVPVAPSTPTNCDYIRASTWMQLALVLARGRKIWKARRDDRSTRAFPFAFVSKFQDILIVLIVSFSQFVMKRITYGQGGLILSCSGLFRYLYHVITSLRCMKDKK